MRKRYVDGAPDYQRGEKKDRKWHIICTGVEALIAAKELRTEDVMLWVCWQSIYQDNEDEKSKGMMSMITYATLCQYMLVPTEEDYLQGVAAKHPEGIPGYGTRGWQMRTDQTSATLLCFCSCSQYLSVDVEG